jgi:uncharacterized protein YecE (DUF72 family)
VSILIGTSGFSYDDWKGFFYPPNLKRGEMLTYYARHFRTVEINSSYYRIPSPSTMQQMTRKVPEGFEFAVKAHGDMTHSDRFKPEAFAQFREALQPLQEAGMLGCVLAQFPWSFKPSAENERFLRTFQKELQDVATIVEFRNSAWARDETYELLRSLELGFCCVDEPRLKGLMPPIVTHTSPVGYVRFHGRNAKKWWHHDQAFERYNYLYSGEELQEWVPKVEELAAETEKTYLFFNNHYEGKAGHNARQLAQLLELPLPMPDPDQGTLSLGDPPPALHVQGVSSQNRG